MNRFVVVALLVSTAVSTTLAVPGIAHAQAQQPTTQASAGPPKVTWAISRGVSRPARDLPSKARPIGSPQIIPSPHLHAFQSGAQAQPDRVRQSAAPRPLVATTSGLNIAGLGSGDYGYSDAWIPPDTNGAVGLTQYVQGVNTSFAIFDKSTGALLLERDFYQLW